MKKPPKKKAAEVRKFDPELINQLRDNGLREHAITELEANVFWRRGIKKINDKRFGLSHKSERKIIDNLTKSLASFASDLNEMSHQNTPYFRYRHKFKTFYEHQQRLLPELAEMSEVLSQLALPPRSAKKKETSKTSI